MTPQLCFVLRHRCLLGDMHLLTYLLTGRWQSVVSKERMSVGHYDAIATRLTDVTAVLETIAAADVHVSLSS